MSFIVSASWIATAALAMLPLVTPATRRPTFPETAVAATLGVCTGAVAWLVGLTVWGYQGAVGCSVAVLAAGALAAVITRRWSLIPRPPRAGGPAIALSLLLALWASPFLAGVLIMTPGRFPARFFNVDTPFRLVHVRELLRATDLPPESLSNLDVRSANHYGGPAVTAAIAGISGLPAHKALFALTLPVAVSGLYSAALLIVSGAAGNGSAALRTALVGVLLTAWLWPLPTFLEAVRVALSTASGASIGGFLTSLWRDTQSFDNGFTDTTQLLGRTLFLLACLPLVLLSSRAFWVAAYAVVLLGQVKTGHAVIGGIALACAATVESIRTRRWAVLLPVLIAAAGTFVLMRLGRVGDLFQLQIEPLWMVRHFPDLARRHLASFIWIAALPAVCAVVAARQRVGTRQVASRTVAPLVAVCAIYLFFNVIGASWPGRSWVPGTPPAPEPFAPFLEPLLQMPMLFGIVAGATVSVLWRRKTQAAILIAIAVLTVPALVHRLRGAIWMLSMPEIAHEQADNRGIAAALETIPVHGSVTATNDLRYPADNYSRDLLQFQIPALFGHQAYGLPGWDRYPGWDERVLLQRRLAAPTVPCETLEALSRDRVTHILLHTDWPHPATLPLKKTYESDEYLVYDLRSLQNCGS